MRTLVHPDNPLLGLGMASLVLAFIALIVFFMPVLGIPISVIALCFGIIGFGVALFTPTAALRWGLAGIAASCLALAVNVAIAKAPSGYLPERRVPTPWQQPPDRPYVPPPAS
jgi:phosphate/sulfate permease